VPVQPAPITEERLVLGEGDSDSAFFRYLCQVRNIPGFQFEHVGGNAGFKDYLNGLIGRSGFRSKLRTIILVGDNDETPNQSFQDIRRQIPRSLPQPENPRQKAKRPDSPYVVVLMLPYPAINGSWHGCLESMLLESANAHLAVQAACAQTFSACVGSNAWSLTAQAKLKLRCILSGSWPDDPNSALPYCVKPDRNLIPLTHNIFDEIESFLRNLDAWLGSDYGSWEDWKNNQQQAAPAP
jgi:hypothetical protein